MGSEKQQHSLRFHSRYHRESGEMYKRLYNLLDLPRSRRISQRIQRTYEHSSSIETRLPNIAHVKHRNLDAVNIYGRDLTTAADREMIYVITRTLWTDVQRLCRRTYENAGAAFGPVHDAAALSHARLHPQR